MKLLQHLKRRPSVLIYTFFAFLAVLISNKLGISIGNLNQAWVNAGVLWSEMFPPDFSVVTERASWTQTECNWEADWAAIAKIHAAIHECLVRNHSDCLLE